MEKRQITLKVLDGQYAIARLAPAASVPAWADGPGFVSISRTDEELSIVCLAERMPKEIRADRDWVCLKFIGPFAFDETGIAVSVLRPLSEGGVGIFLVSTFDTDFLLLKRKDLEQGKMLLRKAGHTVV